MFSRWRCNLLLLLVAIAFSSVEAFQPSAAPGNSASRSLAFVSMGQRPLFMQNPAFDDDEEEEDGRIDPDLLGDWRDFRRNLAANPERQETTQQKEVRRSVSTENEHVLKSQSQDLAFEYTSGVWAHVTATPEVGGLVVRLPLEVELHRNFKHSLTGRKLHQDNKNIEDAKPAVWYKKAQRMMEEEMLEIAEEAGDDGQIDAVGLNDQHAEMLQLYLDNQETWQEVCLVVERDEKEGTASALVLNRPMGFKLTENLGQLVLFGAYRTGDGKNRKATPPRADLLKFMLAFGAECAVYVGGPDDQDNAAEIIHGIEHLPGAVEISPGSRIYRGGVDAAIDGVLRGLYNPLDFRFFIGCHQYDESWLDVSVVLGKYQPIACARTLALKQCISLPKPLWHEVLELCGGDMEEISNLELLKRDDIRFQVIDEDQFSDDDDLDELEKLDESDEDDDFYSD